MLECVVNVSEGRNPSLLARLDSACGSELLDRHTDAHHHRSVFTLVGEAAPRRLAAVAVDLLDLARHEGVHPRIGVLDVVPFVPLAGSTLPEAVAARDRFAQWAADELGLPCYLYGDERSLPEVRRRAFVDLSPDMGPTAAHPTAGACAVGARGVLVAYNLWLSNADLGTARSIAAELRGPAVRTLALQVGDAVQVSMNLIAPEVVGPADVYDQVTALAAIDRAELVGLVPRAVLERARRDRWGQLDLGEDRTIEARLATYF